MQYIYYTMNIYANISNTTINNVVCTPWCNIYVVSVHILSHFKKEQLCVHSSYTMLNITV